MSTESPAVAKTGNGEDTVPATEYERIRNLLHEKEMEMTKLRQENAVLKQVSLSRAMASTNCF